MFEVIFIHPFFGYAHTKLNVLLKYHKELYFYIQVSVIISFLIFYLQDVLAEIRLKSFSKASFFTFFLNLPDLTPVCGNTSLFCYKYTFLSNCYIIVLHPLLFILNLCF
jgi:hypothetical protein